MTSNTSRAAALVAAVMVGVTSLVAFSAASATPAPKVTLCHAAGQDGTTKFVTLTISHKAAYGQAGHFNEDGTPRAGHEDDYLGPCKTDTTTTVAPTTTVPTTVTSTTVPTTTPPTIIPPVAVVQRPGAPAVPVVVDELPYTG